MNPNTQGAQSGKTKSRTGIWITAGVSILALVIIAFLLFLRGTEITVVPRTHTVVFDEQTLYTATPEASAATGTLSYTVLTTTLEESVSVEATSSETVEDHASGKITILNTHSDEAVRLIKNTRFETSAGLIYRIRDSVVVPGMKGTSPGVLEVTVYADAPGERYNIGPVDRFTLPGLKTTAPDMFATVYARSTASMSGGFVGNRPKVSDRDLESARAQLRTRLQEKVQTAAKTDDSSVYAFPELATVKYTSQSPTFDENGAARIIEQATLSTPAFSASEFAKSVAAATSADAGEGIVTIQDAGAFTVTLTEQTEAPIIGEDSLQFTLSGSARFVWDVDSAALAQDLSGKEKDAFSAILESYPGIETAEATIRPFWKTTFPNDPSDIVVVVLAEAS
jgi:hypothetical protein